MAFSLQGDRVIGLPGFSGMAEECITDHKVALLLNIHPWRFFFCCLSFSPIPQSFSFLFLYSFGYILFLSQALLSFKC